VSSLDWKTKVRRSWALEYGLMGAKGKSPGYNGKMDLKV